MCLDLLLLVHFSTCERARLANKFVIGHLYEDAYIFIGFQVFCPFFILPTVTCSIMCVLFFLTNAVSDGKGFVLLCIPVSLFTFCVHKNIIS